METTTAYEIKETTWTPRTFIIKKDKLPFDKLTQFFGEQYSAIYDAVNKTKALSIQQPYAFYYSVDEDKKTTELAAAVQVNDPTVKVPGFETITLPASKLIMTTHIGSFETMGPAYEEMKKYVKEKGLKTELMIEHYLSDPAVEKDPTKWETIIYFIVK